jgi:outer membrane lipoprotein carrier protein LolA
VILRLLMGFAVLVCLLRSDPARPAEATPRMLAAGEMLRGRFVQERELAGFTKTLRSEGHFVLIGGRGLIWSAEIPFKNTTVITAGGILQVVNGQEAMRLPAARLPVISRFYDVLSGALSGDTRALQHDFTVERSADASRWHLRLSPARPNDPALGQVKTIAVSGSTLVDQVDISKAEGDADHLRFLDQIVSPLALTAEESALLDSAAR